MALDLIQIEQEAELIRQKIELGELVEGCCMAGVQTPVLEAWDIAQVLTENDVLFPAQKKEVFLKLAANVQQQLEATGYDDFDVVYEWLLQLSIE